MDSRLLRWSIFSVLSDADVYSQQQDWIAVMGSSQQIRMKNDLVNLLLGTSYDCIDPRVQGWVMATGWNPRLQ